MSLELPADLRNFVDQAVIAGKYPSEAAVLLTALRELKERELKAAHDEWLRKELAPAIASLQRGEGIPAEVVFRQLAEEFPDLFDDEDDAESDSQCA